MGDDTSPLSVILVSSGSRGNKLLFRYPFQRGREHPAAQTNKPRSRYAVNNTGDHADDQDGDSRAWMTGRSCSFLCTLPFLTLGTALRVADIRNHHFRLLTFILKLSKW
uniref:NPR3 like, GATOR1 complex subunit n=1 Tax=Equus caballus TaxID=9796 RepID=A0A9L0RCM5_HORSE